MVRFPDMIIRSLYQGWLKTTRRKGMDSQGKFIRHYVQF